MERTMLSVFISSNASPIPDSLSLLNLFLVSVTLLIPILYEASNTSLTLPLFRRQQLTYEYTALPLCAVLSRLNSRQSFALLR